MTESSKPREWWIFKGGSNFCSELVMDIDSEAMVKQEPEGFYDIVSLSDTIQGGIHVIEKSHYDQALARIKLLEESLIWLVRHSIFTASISKARGAEILGVSLIDLDNVLAKARLNKESKK